MRYCGRTFSAQELELIRSLMAEHPGHHRLALSRLVCERLDWRRPNGGLKDMSCRVPRRDATFGESWLVCAYAAETQTCSEGGTERRAGSALRVPGLS